MRRRASAAAPCEWMRHAPPAPMPEPRAAAPGASTVLSELSTCSFQSSPASKQPAFLVAPIKLLMKRCPSSRTLHPCPPGALSNPRPASCADRRAAAATMRRPSACAGSVRSGGEVGAVRAGGVQRRTVVCEATEQSPA
eukprot:scaffold51117_cov75-Phaeocystis_antarctica.AAC.5